MKRYHFLTEKEIYESLNRLRNAFLAAKDGKDVDEIINGLLTHDEKVKLGRRIIISEMMDSMTTTELVGISHVGRTTISLVSRLMEAHPRCFELINLRKNKVEKEYRAKRYRKVGGSTLVFKKKEYTGIKRSDIKR